MSIIYESCLSADDKNLYCLSDKNDLIFKNIFEEFQNFKSISDAIVHKFEYHFSSENIISRENIENIDTENSTILSFKLSIKQFSNDIFIVNILNPLSKELTYRKKLLRSQLKDLYVKIVNFEKSLHLATADTNILISEQLKSYLLTVPKQVNFPVNTDLRNPFEILNLQEKTHVQKRVESIIDKINLYGSFMFVSNCGGGKTNAILYAISYLKQKTLIISSRNAVNDQWFKQLSELYPELIINKKDGNYKNFQKIRKTKKQCSENVLAPDVYIYTPHYIVKHFENLTFDVGVIVYDEIHALIGDTFNRVLQYPFLRVLQNRDSQQNNSYSELPYLIGLTATLPATSSKGYRLLYKIFGNNFKSISKIIDIPVHIYDYYDHYKYKRGKFDQYYNSMDEFECVQYYVKMIDEINKCYNKPHSENNNFKYDFNNKIDVNDSRYKGIIMTETIYESFRAALFIYMHWNINVLIIRSVDEASIYLEKETYKEKLIQNGLIIMKNDREFTVTKDDIDVSLFKNNDIGVILKNMEYLQYITDANVIVGTIPRLKEGFSVQNATWSICTKFYWSIISRVQILGRIRRMSANEDLNNKYRIMFTCSGKIPSNYSNPYNPVKYISYDLDAEKYIFKNENYIRLI